MENLFENFINKKGNGKGKGIGKNKRAINTNSLYNFSLSCDDIKWGCDWMTFISMENSSLKNLCPCFYKIANDTNSNQIIIPGNELSSCPFESVSVIKNSLNKYQEYYDIFVVYEGETYHIMQFGFYSESDPGKKIMADFKIYGQCWRLQSILDNKFLILGFVPSLLSWGLDINISSFDMEEDTDEYLVLKAFETYYLTRYDFRIDFFHPDRNLISIPKYKDIRITKRKHGDTPFENFEPSRDVPKGYLDHDYTGYTVGKRSNKYVYLRFYHKQVDIFRTGEKTLYYDYIKYNGSVWRLEFEFGSRFTTAGPEKYDFFDAICRFQERVFEYLGINSKTSPFSKFYSLGGVPFNEKSQFQKSIVIGQFASIGDKFNRSGINPFSALIASLKLKKNYTDTQIDKLILDMVNDKKLFNDTLKAFGIDIIDE